jgi:D-alanine-D-alanine ligase
MGKVFMEKIHLGILMGGRSGEHEVSLVSAASVLEVLDTDRYDILPIGITRQGTWVIGKNLFEKLGQNVIASLTPVVLLDSPKPGSLYSIKKEANRSILDPIAQLDVVFPILHGTFGEDGTIQGLLELMKVAYVGCGVLASSLCMDKGLTKEVLRANGIPVLDSMVFSSKEIHQDIQSVIGQVEKMSGYPIFAKPANLGSSVGIAKATDRQTLETAILDAARYDRRVIVEKGLDKPREIEIAVLGNHEPIASTPGEIIPEDEFYTYNAKYHDPRTGLVIPAPIPDETVSRIQSLAIAAFKATDCAGMARVDFLLDRRTGNLFISELNTIPGFTPVSMYPKLWDFSGITYPSLINRLVELALERKTENDQLIRAYGVKA